MESELSTNGLFVDDLLYTLRIINPSISNDTTDLKDESRLYTTKLADFCENFNELLNILVHRFSVEIDQEKMRTIGAENALKVLLSRQVRERQEIQSEILERTNELERLKLEHQYFLQVESQQREVIENFHANQ